MTTQHIILFSITGGVCALLPYGRWRYDLVVALLFGVVPKEQTFSGFGHPAIQPR